MNKKMSLTLIAIGLGMSLSNIAAAQEKLIVYTSMKESLIGALKAKFTEKYPDVEMDYQSAGAGKLMAKIATEKESGKIMADVMFPLKQTISLILSLTSMVLLPQSASAH